MKNSLLSAFFHPKTSNPSSSCCAALRAPSVLAASRGLQPQGFRMGTPRDACEHGPCPCRARGFVLAFPGAKSLTSLSNSLKSRKKRNRPELPGVGNTLPGHGQRALPNPQPQRQRNPHLLLFQEQRSRKEAESLVLRAPAPSELRHPIRAPWGVPDPPTAPGLGRASPRPRPAPGTIAVCSFPGAELFRQPGSSSRCFALILPSNTPRTLNARGPRAGDPPARQREHSFPDQNRTLSSLRAHGARQC